MNIEQPRAASDPAALRNYYFSDALEIETHISACDEMDGKYIVQLERTIFHPKGGGQLADKGRINGNEVLSVASHGDAIHHIVGQPLSIGSARIEIDRETRALHTRLHSAGHLIGHVGAAHGMLPAKAQHWPAASWVVFQCDESIAPDLTVIEAEIQTLIGQNLARTCQMKDGLRVIGFGDLPAFPCGGTHVRSLVEIGAVRLLAMKCKKNLVTVSYDLS